jgi:hypothetical protein
VTWTKHEPIEGFSHCLNCPPRPKVADLDTPLAIGFGAVAIVRDDEFVWSADDPDKLLSEFEEQAKADPDHDWRLQIDGPLYSAVYQRHDEGQWVLVERGEGFA